MPRPFHILHVCTGNICRSPVAERLTTAGLATRLGSDGTERVDVTVSSAGVRALVGRPIDPPSLTALHELGGDGTGFAARQLTEEMVRDADLVLVATRKHRATVVRMVPSAATRVFTLREFARLARDVDPAALPGTSALERLGDVVIAAHSARGRVRKTAEGDDDVPDPHGAGPDQHRAVATVIAAQLEPSIDLVAAAVAPERLPVAVAAGTSRHAPAGVGRRGRETARVQAHRWRRTALGTLALLVVLLLAGGAYVAFSGYRAKVQLTAARSTAGQLRADVVRGDRAEAGVRLRALQQRTRRAASMTSGSLWATAAHLPLVGDDVRAVRQMAVSLDDVSQRVLPPLVTAADLDPSSLRPAGDRIDLAPVQRAAPSLRRAARAAARVRATVAAVPTRALLPPVRRAVDDVRREVDDLAAQTRVAAGAAQLLPPLMGSTGRRSYLLAFQNNAEARGTGGLLGAYGILDVDHGKVTVRELGSNQELANAPRLPVDLGADFRRIYGTDTRLWVNANASSHFPYAARIWLALWQQQHHERLDGVVATDPVAMARVLGAVGPVSLPQGGTVSATNAVRLTLHDVYERFPLQRQNTPRDRYLLTVAGAVVDRVLSGKGDPRELVTALTWAAQQRRLLVYSTDPSLQSELARFRIAGEIPTGTRPYFEMTVNSGVASKLDYYLARSLTYRSSGCTTAVRRVEATITLTNRAPSSGLPSYVAPPPGRRRVPALAGAPRGTDYLVLDVLTTDGTGLRSASVDGRRTGVSVARLRGHPVFTLAVTLRPGQSRTIRFRLLEPRSAGRLTIERQPLVRPLRVSVQDAAC